MSFIAYIVLLSICVASVLTTKSLTSNILKVLIVVVLIHGYITTWSTYKQISGYPTTDELPQRFEIIWARVVESSTSDDFIELWIASDTPVIDKIMARFSLAHSWNNVSRVYRIPYNAENHQAVLEIQKKIELGEKVGVKNINKELDLRKGSEQYSIEFEEKKITK